MKQDLIITKASGERDIFSEKKLRWSLQRAGANGEQINKIIDDISGKLYPGISTRKIYTLAFKLLRGSSRPSAAKYQLKRAIMELGPSGFPFEKFVGEIMRSQGYQVKVGELVKGQCVQHEIDVIAVRDNTQLMIECKYHNLQGTICDVKIPLYIQSRFKDVESQWIKAVDGKITNYQGVVVTNTRFSDDAIQYGTCAGLRLIGWDYPSKGSLKDQVDSQGLYPVTCLTSLTKREKQYLLDRKIVLAQELYNNKHLLMEARISPARMDSVVEEAYHLCQQLIAPRS